MASVTRNIKSKYGWYFHPYGNVGGREPYHVWSTVEDLSRYSHNYWGLRNRIGILSETYSYLTFRDRFITDNRFLEEILNYAGENAARIKKVTEDADKRSVVGQRLSLRSKLKRSDQMTEILMGFCRRRSRARLRGSRLTVSRCRNCHGPRKRCHSKSFRLKVMLPQRRLSRIIKKER